MHYAELNGFREALWMVSHWFDTRTTLHELGYPSIRGMEGVVKRLKIVISDDMLLRIAGGVAGAAKFTVYYAALQKLKSSAYSLAVAMDCDLNVMDEQMEAIKKDPLRYHMGSGYLTGKEKLNCDIFSDDDKTTISAFVHVVLKGHTLEQSPSIMTNAEVASSIAYTKLQAMRVKMTQSIDLKVIMKVLNKGGVSTNCLALKTGLFTQAQIDQAVKDVKAEEDAKKKKQKEKTTGDEEEADSEKEDSGDV